MIRYKYIIQFILTLSISLIMTSTFLKSIILIGFWALTFRPLKKSELLQFLIINIIFVFSNFAALKNGVFEFTQKDILLMPFNELFMWGFYYLNAARFLDLKDLSTGHLKPAIVYAFLFTVGFSVIRDEWTLAVFSAALLMGALILFHTHQDITCVSMFIFMGILVEGTGVWKGLWHYPGAHFTLFPLWTPLMWTNIGLILSRLGPALMRRLEFKSQQF